MKSRNRKQNGTLSPSIPSSPTSPSFNSFFGEVHSPLIPAAATQMVMWNNEEPKFGMGKE